MICTNSVNLDNSKLCHSPLCGDTPTKLYLDTIKKLPRKLFTHNSFLNFYKRIFYISFNMQNILYLRINTVTHTYVLICSTCIVTVSIPPILILYPPCIYKWTLKVHLYFLKDVLVEFHGVNLKGFKGFTSLALR